MDEYKHKSLEELRFEGMCDDEKVYVIKILLNHETVDVKVLYGVLGCYDYYPILADLIQKVILFKMCALTPYMKFMGSLLRN